MIYNVFLKGIKVNVKFSFMISMQSEKSQKKIPKIDTKEGMNFIENGGGVETRGFCLKKCQKYSNLNPEIWNN